MSTIKYFVFLSAFFLACASGQTPEKKTTTTQAADTVKEPPIQVGAERLDLYLPLLKDKRVGLVANQTATIHQTHLADVLLRKGVELTRIFSPEHGFRGKADAGAKVKGGKDPVTGLPVISLYGKNKKPKAEQLQGLDVVVFDIQDVGARFYTYISTLHYVMEACAENHIPVVILDRPNPNGYYVDGPVLNPKFKSFIGMHPIPIVHGMTIGEYGKMINGEAWLKGGIQADLTVIPCAHYNHRMAYSLPIKPSPNLPNDRSILLYPSLCLFEGTVISVGRGTDKQFQIFGHPDLPEGDFVFTPKPMPGARHPKLEGKTCKGFNLSELSLDKIRQPKQLNLTYLLRAYALFPDKKNFFLKNHFFDKLAGSDVLRKQIEQGLTEKEIRNSWAGGLTKFKKIRQKYLLYK